MRYIIAIIVGVIFSFTSKLFAQTASFIAPDTVCKGQNITIANTTTGQSTNLWNFCKQSPTSVITGVNLGGAGLPSRPASMQIYKDGANYIGFVSNEQTFGSGVRRLNFGTNLLNPSPVVDVLSTFSGQLDGPKGMKFIYDGGNWYGFYLADNWTAGYSYIFVRLNFGNSLLNTPTITNFMTLGGVLNEYLTDLAIEKTSQGYIGFIVTTSGNLFRLNFGNDITSTPVATNLGTLGGAKTTYSFNLFQRNGNWYLFMPKDDYAPITNAYLVSLNFGNSLLNTPSVINYGNPGNLLNRAYDFLPFIDCDNFKGYVLAPGANKIIEYTFPQDINSTSISGRDIGNVANFSFPSDFSNVQVYNNEKYVFITNQTSNTISRVKLSNNCNSFGVPSSILTNPPVFHIDSVGTYNISLVVNENLSTESRVCHEIVVVDSIKKPDARINTITCSTDSIRLTIANIDTTATYSWTGPNGFTSTRPNVSIKFNGNNTQNGNYIVTSTGRCGIKKDTVMINANCVVCVPNFTAPDTVCIKQNVVIQNQTTCATTNYWNFCSGNLDDTPIGTNIGNVGSALSSPVYVELVSDNNVKYAFVVNHTGAIVRLKYGSSYLNTPILTSFGNMGVTNFNYLEGIQIKKDVNGNWYGFVNAGGIVDPKLVRLLFGSNLDNTPTAVDLGNISGTSFPGDIYVFQESNNWYAFITSSQSNTIIRLNFGLSLANIPTATNLGNFGVLSSIGELSITNENGNWYMFVGSNSQIARLNFGNSLLNNNPSVFSFTLPVTPPYGIKLLKDCGNNFGFITHPNNTITKMEFPNGISGTPVFTNLGNIASFNFPHSISNIFRDGDSVFMLIPNVNSNSLSRILFKNCTNASISSSTLLNPPIYSYNQIGIFNISYTLDEGTPTQSTICKSIVVVDTIKKPEAHINTITCSTDSIRLTIANVDSTATYSWTGPIGFSSTRPNVTIKFTGANQAGQYIVTASGRCGTKKDTVSFIAPTPFVVNLGRDTSICQGSSITLNATTSGTTVTYLWSTGAVTPSISVNQTNTYWVKVTVDGCSATDTIKVTILTPPNAFSIGNDTTYCGSFSRILSTGNANTVWSTGVTASQITVTQAGTYIATITNSCGSKRDTIVIKQNNIPLVNLGRDTSICQGSSITLNATTSGTTVTYLWSTGSVTPSISVNQTNTYWVKVTADGCSATDTIKVTILTPPNAFSIGNDTTYCGSFSRILSTGNANTVWSTGVTASQITVTQAGTYIATITNSCGSKRDTIVIKQNIIPLVNLGRDTSICQGLSVNLNATTSGATVTYLWSTGAVTPSISVNQTNTYWVKVTADGCSATDTIKVTILTPPNAFSIGNDTTYCGNFSRVLSTGNANTVWSTGVTASQITVTQAGMYIASITNNCGNETDTINIQENSIPTVYINKDTVICDGNLIELSAVTDAQKYVWSTGDTTKNINISQHGIYWVDVSNNNCTASDTAFIDECEGDLWVPNAFTPNNDNINDVFQVFGKRLIEYHLIVFNRWGEKLFESFDINNSWNGTQKGELVQVDAYAWVIFYTINLDGRVQDKMKKGTVAVLR